MQEKWIYAHFLTPRFPVDAGACCTVVVDLRADGHSPGCAQALVRGGLGRAWDGVAIPFLKDVEAQTCFLVALPLLILAEKMVHERFRPTETLFLEKGLIRPADRSRFDVVRSMRFLPFGPHHVIQLTEMIALPAIPLVLAIMPLERVVKLLIGTLL